MAVITPEQRILFAMSLPNQLAEKYEDFIEDVAKRISEKEAAKVLRYGSEFVENMKTDPRAAAQAATAIRLLFPNETGKAMEEFIYRFSADGQQLFDILHPDKENLNDEEKRLQGLCNRTSEIFNNPFSSVKYEAVLLAGHLSELQTPFSQEILQSKGVLLPEQQSELEAKLDNKRLNMLESQSRFDMLNGRSGNILSRNRQAYETQQNTYFVAHVHGNDIVLQSVGALSGVQVAVPSTPETLRAFAVAAEVALSEQEAQSPKFNAQIEEAQCCADSIISSIDNATRSDGQGHNIDEIETETI